MKVLLSIIIILGLIALYLMSAAFHIDYFDNEMIIHNTVRFVAGFVFLGIWVWYKHRLKLKVALYCILFLLVLDDIIDYIRDINNLKLEMVIQDSFVVIWGAVTGYLFARSLKHNLAQRED